jgi:hypothetical protein
VIPGDNIGARHGRLLAEVERAERKMRRAIRTWQRSLGALKACRKRYLETKPSQEERTP